ncbi:MAG: DUF4280 domain-containing protein [Planctomycetaceae bacterium]|nr:DUF4280 domain-containing protein [Planctomycetaceae bacterium]
MAQLVAMSAMMACTSGTAPSTLVVVVPTVTAESKPAANIMDHVPMMNIMPFGTCNVLTAAALGVPTPCVPAVVAPWAPGSATVTLRGMPALNNTSKCACVIGGAISITNPGTTKESVA